MKKKILVVGGGTAGIMSATYLKSYWGDLVDVSLVYDHNVPGIGVGESLTPIFDNFLKTVGVSTVDLIKNCNATIKLGLRFKDWVHEGSDAYHTFPINEVLETVSITDTLFNTIDAYDTLINRYNWGTGYDWTYFKSNLIPNDNNLLYRHALHVDANLLGRYIEARFKDKINIIDGIVSKVIVDNKNISSIKFTNGLELKADFYIDASGLNKVLIKELTDDWIDISELLPTNRTIPYPLFKEYDYLPAYTTATASKNGWILDVPLSNRRGTGYVYSSKFTSDQEAKEDFNRWLLKEHNVELASDRVIKFSNGYWKNTWVGNCATIGLSSGFVEPLEATSLHHVVIQLESLTKFNCLQNLEHSKSIYNTSINDMYENAYKYIRFFYHTKRQNSDFWKYLYNNQPKWLKELDEKIQKSFLHTNDINSGTHSMFATDSFISVAKGHKMFTEKGIEEYLQSNYLLNYSKAMSDKVVAIKRSLKPYSVDHKTWINKIKGI